MPRRARSPMSVLVLSLAACVPTPGEVVSTSGTSTADASTSASASATASTTAPPSDQTTAQPTSTSEPDLDSSSGPAMGTSTDASSSSGAGGCGGPDGCDGNHECVDDRCVEACGGRWGTGSYGYCLDEYGEFDTDAACGPDHLCVFWSDRSGRIGDTACTLQGCVNACDCPPPADTGNATVTCGQITADEQATDCYLSCESGETCPDDMICNDAGVCTTAVPELPMYGDCGNLAPDCAAPGFCYGVMEGEAVCTQSCTDATDCPTDIPPGGNAVVTCTDVVPDSPGFECYLSCVAALSCPDGMTCINGTLCMWQD